MARDKVYETAICAVVRTTGKGVKLTQEQEERLKVYIAKLCSGDVVAMLVDKPTRV